MSVGNKKDMAIVAAAIAELVDGDNAPNECELNGEGDNHDTLGIEAIISLALAGLTLLVTFIGHYFYVRGKLHKAAAGAITNAEQDDKTGEEKLELAVDQVYSLVPTSLKVFIHRGTVKKIVQAAFDKIEDYAKKQVENKGGKNKAKDEAATKIDTNSSSEAIVSPQGGEYINDDSKVDQANSGEDVHSQEEPPKPIGWYLI